MPLDLSRRRLLAASLGLLVAPSIVRAASIMPVKVVEPPLQYMGVDLAFEPDSTMLVYFCNPIYVHFQSRTFWYSDGNAVEEIPCA